MNRRVIWSVTERPRELSAMIICQIEGSALAGPFVELLTAMLWNLGLGVGNF